MMIFHRIQIQREKENVFLITRQRTILERQSERDRLNSVKV